MEVISRSELLEAIEMRVRNWPGLIKANPEKPFVQVVHDGIGELEELVKCIEHLKKFRENFNRLYYIPSRTFYKDVKTGELITFSDIDENLQNVSSYLRRLHGSHGYRKSKASTSKRGQPNPDRVLCVYIYLFLEHCGTDENVDWLFSAMKQGGDIDELLSKIETPIFDIVIPRYATASNPSNDRDRWKIDVKSRIMRSFNLEGVIRDEFRDLAKQYKRGSNINNLLKFLYDKH